MRAELDFSFAAVFGFLLTLARVGGALVFVPLPGFGAAPRLVRAVLAGSIAMILAPLWPRIEAPPGAGTMLRWLAVEAALGLTAGVAVSFLAEGFLVACQTLGLQAGYSYATTIDPTSQADAGVLQVLGQLAASLLFVAGGLDRQVLLAFARSLEQFPAGTFRVTGAMGEAIIGLGAGMLTLGLRLALPVIALLMLVDVALALLGRVNAQLQLLTLAFPLKMLAGLVMLAALATLFPVLYGQAASQTAGFLARLGGGG